MPMGECEQTKATPGYGAVRAHRTQLEVSALAPVRLLSMVLAPSCQQFHHDNVHGHLVTGMLISDLSARL